MTDPMPQDPGAADENTTGDPSNTPIEQLVTDTDAADLGPDTLRAAYDGATEQPDPNQQ